MERFSLKRRESLTSRLQGACMKLACDIRLSLSDLQQQDASFSRKRQHLTLTTALLGATITFVLNLTIFQSHLGERKSLWCCSLDDEIAPRSTKTAAVV